MKYLSVPQSGSQAGTTASRNRYGQYYRTRATPVNPKTPSQGLTRSNFAFGATGWRGLTDAQREAWQSFAADHPKTNSLGQTIVLTGSCCFTGANSLQRRLGLLTAITDPPLISGIPAVPVITITATGPGTLSLAFTGAPAAGDYWQIEAGAPVSQGVQFYNNYKFLTAADSTSTTPLAVGTLYTALWGTMITGQKIFLRVRYVVAGQFGGPWRPQTKVIS